MTKLMEWLSAGTAIFIAWITVLISRSSSPTGVEWYIKYFPVIFAFCFGLYAFIIIMYRVWTFNDCEEAAIELKKQIQEARADLESKGIVLKKSKE